MASLDIFKNKITHKTILLYLCQAGGRKGKKKVCVNTLILNCQTVCLTVKLSLTLFQTTNLDAPTLKEFVDDNLELMKMVESSTKG